MHPLLENINLFDISSLTEENVKDILTEARVLPEKTSTPMCPFSTFFYTLEYCISRQVSVLNSRHTNLHSGSQSSSNPDIHHYVEFLFRRATSPSNSCGLYSKTVPSDTTLNSPIKRTLKNLRLKSDRKRLIDDDGFQTPDKRHTSKKIGKKNPSLPPTTSQTSNPTPPAESSDSEIEDEDAGKSNLRWHLKTEFQFCQPSLTIGALNSIARQLAPTLISKTNW
ncbi:hypothetical protein TNIN_109591 [Trichonephila inaurata madagascariensis]|uniref:Uncharacterized protein n=1 Tax=Trichonephila inaurata madagascariensis TaxID=2747483 RepID=A0A8X6YDS8_9ARAC|nr:hypothetical protein TNIN_109591 [Trichonephila inaurata madagascariensis]